MFHEGGAREKNKKLRGKTRIPCIKPPLTLYTPKPVFARPNPVSANLLDFERSVERPSMFFFCRTCKSHPKTGGHGGGAPEYTFRRHFRPPASGGGGGDTAGGSLPRGRGVKIYGKSGAPTTSAHIHTERSGTRAFPAHLHPALAEKSSRQGGERALFSSFRNSFAEP